MIRKKDKILVILESILIAVLLDINRPFKANKDNKSINTPLVMLKVLRLLKFAAGLVEQMVVIIAN
jgi:hypothetical protein